MEFLSCLYRSWPDGLGPANCCVAQPLAAGLAGARAGSFRRLVEVEHAGWSFACELNPVALEFFWLLDGYSVTAGPQWFDLYQPPVAF